MAEYNGLSNASHIAQKITRMLQLNDTSLACATAAAYFGKEEPEGSGVFMPDETMGNIAKLNTNDGFWEVLALAGDISGGIPATMPSEKELENPEVKEYVAKYLKAAAPAEEENAYFPLSAELGRRPSRAGDLSGIRPQPESVRLHIPCGGPGKQKTDGPGSGQYGFIKIYISGRGRGLGSRCAVRMVRVERRRK